MLSLILMMICEVESVMKRVGERRKFNYVGMLAWPRPIWPVGAGHKQTADYVKTTTAVPRLRISLRRLVHILLYFHIQHNQYTSFRPPR